jgi:hypothetical protein
VTIGKTPANHPPPLPEVQRRSARPALGRRGLPPDRAAVPAETAARLDFRQNPIYLRAKREHSARRDTNAGARSRGRARSVPLIPPCATTAPATRMSGSQAAGKRPLGSSPVQLRSFPWDRHWLMASPMESHRAWIWLPMRELYVATGGDTGQLLFMTIPIPLPFFAPSRLAVKLVYCSVLSAVAVALAEATCTSALVCAFAVTSAGASPGAANTRAIIASRSRRTVTASPTWTSV